MVARIRIAITGRPRVGKTTILRRVVERLRCEGVSVGGMLTSDTYAYGTESGKRVRAGFIIEDIDTGERGILAHLHQDGPRVGRYGVNIRDLESVGVGSIRNAVVQGGMDMIVVDEVGPMELRSAKFVKSVTEAIESEKSMLVSVHQRSRHELVERIRADFDVYEVTKENREELVEVILSRCMRVLRGERG